MKAEELPTTKVLVAGIVRNIETTLIHDIRRFQEVFGCFQQTHFYLVESDSKDKSLATLEQAKSLVENFNFISLGNLEEKFPDRTQRLAHARNKYLEAFEKNEEFADIEILAIADFNNLNKLLTRDAIKKVFEDEYWSVRTANQSGPYYDIWALRHPIWSPNDCWESHHFFRKFHKIPELTLYATVNSRMISIPTDVKPIQVISAFGGFGIYKREAIIGKRYSGRDTKTGNAVCEHVPFNESIVDAGHIIEVFPGLINMYKTDHTFRFSPARSLFRILMYLPKYVVKTIKKYSRS